ncbi:hypothetical protein MRB53_013500 [Persea americana]|uniref:Uncharacterized protein n=1 Tax=Persea americana TaxID=3435 RepID=A0ACC2K871_PERAE|nr:hypothetical protein MRB53_013500 [Persea americana]
MGCSYCKKKTIAKHNDAISCSCPHKDATAQPWFRVVANLSDSTGTISATLFGNEMKKLTSCTPIQMMNLFEEGRVDDIEDVVNKFNGQEHIFQLKAYQYGSAVNFTVLSIDDTRTNSQI